MPDYRIICEYEAPLCGETFVVEHDFEFAGVDAATRYARQFVCETRDTPGIGRQLRDASGAVLWSIRRAAQP